MRLVLAFAFFAFSTVVYAQQQHELKLSDAALNVILEALSNAPWRAANPVIADIQRQMQEAAQKKATPPEK